MSIVYQFSVMVDLPAGTNILLAESVLAQAIAIELVDAKVPGNVSVTLQNQYTQTSVATFNPNAVQPIPVKSNGVSTWPGAQPVAVVPVVIPVSLVTDNDPPIVVTPIVPVNPPSAL